MKFAKRSTILVFCRFGHFYKTCKTVSISDKYSLSIQEAAEYYGIGEKRLRNFLTEHWNETFVLEIGTHTRIKRRLFEEYLDQMASV